VKKQTLIMAVLSAGLLATSCGVAPSTRDNDSEHDTLVGAWRAKVRFKSGTFATVKDLEFMYVFNAGGTMTESSNYDASPPVPPAYGVWRKMGPRQFEAKYAFYWTKPPTGFEEIAKGGGWLPGGQGVFSEKITLSEDGKFFQSQMNYDAFDHTGKPSESGSEAETEAVRMDF
jgi:hypothetical protein